MNTRRRRKQGFWPRIWPNNGDKKKSRIKDRHHDRRRSKHFCPQCGQFSGSLQGSKAASVYRKSSGRGIMGGYYPATVQLSAASIRFLTEGVEECRI